MFGWTLIVWARQLFHLALFGLIVWALADVLLRPADDFLYSSQKKPFWVLVFALGVLVGVDRTLFRVIFLVPGFVKSLAYWGVLFAAAYYLGTERKRMGPNTNRPRWPFGKGDAGQGRGSW